MTLLFIRIFFAVLSGVVGFLIGSFYGKEILGLAIGVSGAGFWILIESMLKQVSVRGLSSAVFGLLFGIIMAKLVADILALVPMGMSLQSIIRVVLRLIFT
jgi:uncharacterized protein YacL